MGKEDGKFVTRDINIFSADQRTQTLRERIAVEQSVLAMQAKGYTVEQWERIDERQRDRIERTYFEAAIREVSRQFASIVLAHLDAYDEIPKSYQYQSVDTHANWRDASREELVTGITDHIASALGTTLSYETSQEISRMNLQISPQMFNRVPWKATFQVERQVSIGLGVALPPTVAGQGWGATQIPHTDNVPAVMHIQPKR